MKERLLAVYTQYGDFVFPVLTIILLTTLSIIWWKARKKSLSKTLSSPTHTANVGGTTTYPITA
ncbi:MAG: hypothetical protein HYY22_02180 [Thaumarchaeota archaeon]|nr:hypothetical protein [Nitrososphaerota archaeon]